MVLEQIITRRSFDHRFFYDLVYEWEDVLKKEFNCKYSFDKNMRNAWWAYHIYGFQNLITTTKNSFVFEMVPENAAGHNKKNIVPLIIDFYLKEEQLPCFYKKYCNNKIVFISNKEVLSYLKLNDCPLNIAHLGLSISDKYAINSFTRFEKKYDVALIGRQNVVLKKWIEKYADTHPSFVYVFGVRNSNQLNHYTNKGEFIGNVEKRADFIQLMKACRIGIYATPGTDGGEARTHGFNQVTPRFLEYIACGCHVIARYPKNDDTDYYELPSMAPNINSYEEFESAVDKARTSEVDMDKYARYLQKHYTSVRAKELQSIIQNL
jgi:glycosyltransferase involved in cell wall biosynthesis